MIKLEKENCKINLKLIDENYYLQVKIIRDDIIHISYSKKDIKESPSLIIEKDILNSNYIMNSKESEEYISIQTSKLIADINKKNGKIVWKNAVDGTILLQEGEKILEEIPVYHYMSESDQTVIKKVKSVDGEQFLAENLKKVQVRTAYKGKIFFEFKELEGIYGFGQGEEGYYNLRNHTKYIYQHNLRIPMPFFYSDEGYGMLFDCCSVMAFHDDENEAHIFMDTIEQMDYYMIAGPSPDEVIDGFRHLTGKVTLLPKWALGYIQSKEQYYSARELESIIYKHRELQIPIDCVVQDWHTWIPNRNGEKKLDPKRYGDMEACAERIHNMNAHTMVSIWPCMSSEGDNYKEFAEKGYLLNNLSTYDAFNEDARNIYWRQAKDGLMDHGFDSWWCDASEPFTGPDWAGAIKREDWERFLLVGNEHKKYLDPAVTNAYPLMHAKGLYENQRKEVLDKRVLNLTRSACPSSQKYGVVVWSGDINATWDTLRKQIVEGINMSLSGFPYWTLDIGGFFTVNRNWQKRGCHCSHDSEPRWFWKGDYEEGVADYGYRELYVRWLEFATFLPIFRSHGTDTPREIWNFGSEGEIFYDAIAKFIRLRYELLPYIYTQAGMLWLNNETIVRSLLFDFREDQVARKIKDEYMFGKSFLICPIMHPMFYDKGNRVIENTEIRGRMCYLPEGINWIDYWNGTVYEGGQWIWKDTPIDEIPIFMRSGSIIPIKKNMQYVSDLPEEPMHIYVVSGEDAEFSLYEDEEDNYNYENGDYSCIRFLWKEVSGILTIEERKGKFASMQETRKFIISKFHKDEKIVIYSGKKLEITL